MRTSLRLDDLVEGSTWVEPVPMFEGISVRQSSPRGSLILDLTWAEAAIVRAGIEREEGIEEHRTRGTPPAAGTEGGQG